LEGGWKVRCFRTEYLEWDCKIDLKYTISSSALLTWTRKIIPENSLVTITKQQISEFKQ
jgi:hypothetical protein